MLLRLTVAFKSGVLPRALLPSSPRARRARIAFWITGGSALALTVSVISLWLAREWAGEQVAMAYLRRRGVSAQIHLTRLDVGGIEGSVTLGPPAAPTLVSPHFRVTFDPLSGLKAPRVSHVVLDRPELTVRWESDRFDLGALRPLVEEALRTPKSKVAATPTPHIEVAGGRVRLASSSGDAYALVDMDIAAEGLRSATVRLLPASLSIRQGRVDLLKGELRLRKAEGGYEAELTLAAAAVHGALGQADGVRASAHAHLPSSFLGPAIVGLRLEATAAKGSGWMVTAPVIAGDLTGDVQLGPRPHFKGRAVARVDVARAAHPSATLRAPHMEVALSELSVGSGSAAARFNARVYAASGLLAAAGERIELSALRAAALGRFADAPQAAVTLKVRTSLFAAGGLAPRRAAVLAATAAPGGYGADLRPVLRVALTRSSLSATDLRFAFDGRSWRGGGAPVTLEGGRARLTLSAPTWSLVNGGFDAPRLSARLDGPGATLIALGATATHTGSNGARLAFSLQAQGSAGPARDASLVATGRAEADGQGARLALNGCAPLRLGKFLGEEGKPLAQALSGEVCAAAAPLLVLSRDRTWRAAADVRGLTVQTPEAALAVSGGEINLALHSARNGLNGAAQVRTATVLDTSKPLRFRPLRLSGPLRLEGQRLTGTLEAALARPSAPLGRVQVEQDFAAGSTRLSFRARELEFTPDTLQPAAVLPGLATLGRDVTGAADLDFDLTLKGAQTTSFVHARTTGMQVRTAAGLAQGVDADVTLTALDPLTSPPDQRVAAARIMGPAPLTGIEAHFQIGDQVLQVATARAKLAGGLVTLDPMRIGLQPGDTVTGSVHADGVDLGVLLDSLNLSRTVKVEARLQGVLPFSFGPRGFRLLEGRLQATGPGRFSINRAAISSASTQAFTAAASPSAMQDFAYKALEDLAFSELNAAIASRSQGRLGVVFHIRGRHEPQVGESDRIPLMALLGGHAFDERIPLPKGTEVNLTLDTSLNLDDLLAAYPSLAPAPLPDPPASLPETAGSAQVQPLEPRS